MISWLDKTALGQHAEGWREDGSKIRQDWIHLDRQRWKGSKKQIDNHVYLKKKKKKKKKKPEEGDKNYLYD